MATKKRAAAYLILLTPDSEVVLGSLSASLEPKIKMDGREAWSAKVEACPIGGKFWPQVQNDVKDAAFHELEEQAGKRAVKLVEEHFTVRPSLLLKHPDCDYHLFLCTPNPDSTLDSSAIMLELYCSLSELMETRARDEQLPRLGALYGFKRFPVSSLCDSMSLRDNGRYPLDEKTNLAKGFHELLLCAAAELRTAWHSV